MADLVIARGRGQGRVLEPVQGRFAGQRRTIGSSGLELSGEHGQDWIMAQLVMVDQILVAKREGQDALAHKGWQGVLDVLGATGILEAGGHALDQADGAIGGPQEQGAGIGRDGPTIKGRDHAPPLDGCKSEQIWATVCVHRGAPLNQHKSLWQKHYRRFRTPMHLIPVRNPG